MIFLLPKDSIVLGLELANFGTGKDGFDKKEDDDARRDKLRIDIYIF